MAPVTGAATVGGTFTLGNGEPLANYPVTVTAMDDIPAVGDQASPTVVGSATTGADGTWTFTLPDPLPSHLQALADANGGVLSLEADVYGQAPDGTLLTASDFMSAGTATGPATTEASAAVRAHATAHTVAVLPSTGTTQVQQPADTGTSQSQTTPTDEPDNATGEQATVQAAGSQWQSSTGAPTTDYNPEVVHGATYTAVRPQRSIPCGTTTSTLKTAISYTTVGEAHAGRDATASFDYSNTLSSTWSVMYSVDGKVFKENGKVTHANSMGYSTGFTGQGPHWAKQWRVPIRYAETLATYRCGGIVKSLTYKIAPIGYEVPAGGSVGDYGSDVSAKDGAANYNHAPANRRAIVQQKSYFQLSKGDSLTIGYGATAFGVGISLDTTYNDSHYERITAGSTAIEHDIWGANGPVTNNPGVIYSY